jgi:Tol biopolymer transport system component
MRDKSDRTEIMVQSCDLDGADKTTILQDDHMSAFTWLSSARFIYSRNSEVGAAESDNLWELKVDGKNGSSQGKARQLTDWSGFSVFGFSATADGKQLVFLRGTDHASVFVGDLAGKDNRLVNSRRLTLDDNYNLPLAWTPDSREVIYSSQRASNWLMFRQALDPGSVSQPITHAADTNFYLARLSPDGTWILLEGRAIGSRKVALYRVGLAGGAPQLLFNTEEFVQFWCTNKAANLCVFGQSSKGKNEVVIISFDPLAGPGKELIRIPLEAGTSGDIGFDYVWQLSPDGSRIGIVKRHSNQIRLVPLDGGQTRTITVKDYPDLIDLNWATDSQSMFVSTLEPGTASVLHVDLNGEAQPVWQQPQSVFTWGFPSPDGRHLAILGSNSESNAWMIDNFGAVDGPKPE